MLQHILAIIILTAFLATPAQAQWRGWAETDEMTGKKTHYATSPRTGATKKMAFPYSDTMSWVGVGCDEAGKQWAFVGFTQEPNINDGKTEGGYDLIDTRVKWDNAIVNSYFTQDWGSKFIHWRAKAETIRRIKAGNSMLLELNWHGNGKTYFRYSLAGATKALAPCKTIVNNKEKSLIKKEENPAAKAGALADCEKNNTANCLLYCKENEEELSAGACRKVKAAHKKQRDYWFQVCTTRATQTPHMPLPSGCNNLSPDDLAKIQEIKNK